MRSTVIVARLALLAGLIAAAAALGAAAKTYFQGNGFPGIGAFRPPRPVTVLILGADGGRLEGNTDTVILARIDPNEHRVAALWIPRDTRVSIPGHGRGKINSANPAGGPELAVATIESLMDIRIDYYVLTDFQAVARAIDRLGGVDVDVPQPMHYDDPTQDLHIHLEKGPQHLSGEQAVGFARFRGVALGDIGRTQFQQALVAALAEKVRTPGALLLLPAAARELMNHSRTNLGLEESMDLLKLARRGEWTLVSETLPGSFLTLRGVSYWDVDPARARAAWADLLLGVTHPTVEEGMPPAGTPPAATAP